METHLAVVAVALGFGWILGGKGSKPESLPAVPPCHCHCGCDCPHCPDHTLLFISFLIGWSTVDLGILGFLEPC